MKHSTLRFKMPALALMLLSAGAVGTYAQNSNSAEVKGTVTDSTNASIPGATVKLTNTQTGVVVTTVSNASGIYDVPSVETGRYTLTVTKDGFRDSVRNGISLAVGVVGLDAQLQIGAATSEVVVTADTPLRPDRRLRPAHGLRYESRAGRTHRRRHLVQHPHQ